REVKLPKPPFSREVPNEVRRRVTGELFFGVRSEKRLVEKPSTAYGGPPPFPREVPNGVRRRVTGELFFGVKSGKKGSRKNPPPPTAVPLP
ncbi:MAG: hypothetical protein J6J31_13405, partial [Thermoguttaceae bacterium]|nr:hypothetical protein [Thermoguttaceae bacterium]